MSKSLQKIGRQPLFSTSSSKMSTMSEILIDLKTRWVRHSTPKDHLQKMSQPVINDVFHMVCICFLGEIWWNIRTLRTRTLGWWFRLSWSVAKGHGFTIGGWWISFRFNGDIGCGFSWGYSHYDADIKCQRPPNFGAPKNEYIQY